ncbi:MAG: response regulator [Hyphomicrobiales bacterium]|nr:response regulator [Hyphomicrobiales bacterium]
MRPARRVLVIDDEASFCRFMARMITSLGYEVTTTCQAKCAYLDELKEPDVVFIDMVMPEMDGIQVLEVLADYKVKAAIVLMSGADTSLSKAEAFAKRADLRLIGVLHKPFRLADVQNIFTAD